jgi:hypothetical protein
VALTVCDFNLLEGANSVLLNHNIYRYHNRHDFTNMMSKCLPTSIT